jgi:riboflavin kinase/FMN adenylyltransferase
LQIYRSINSIARGSTEAATHRPLVITIGNFDGCHLGHQALVTAARGLLDGAGGAEVACLTFSPRPAVFFKRSGNDSDLASLFTEEQKAEAMAELGVDHFVVQTFDREFSELPPDRFFDLIRATGCAGVVVGDDFRFGAGRSGDASWLARQCASASIKFLRVEAVTCHGVRASSSTIRREISLSGNVQLAKNLLGREFALDGEIVSGARNGRRIGVPTANLKPLAQVLPRPGVYAGFFVRRDAGFKPSLVAVDAAAMPCVVNVGFRPTVEQSGKSALSIEAHVLDQEIPLDSLYGRAARIYFSARLRDEIKFNSLDELKAQIATDISLARQVLAGRT